jgi:epsilon-lactone hydrolase
MSLAELNFLRQQFLANPFDPAAPLDKLRERIDRFPQLYPVPQGVSVQATHLAQIPAERAVANEAGPVLLYLHGGGYVIGSPASHRHLAALLAQEIEGVVYCLDYRLAPEFPFPAAFEDALAAWGALVQRYPATRCSMAGDSAGGGLAFACTVKLRDQVLSGASAIPMPCCLAGLSPWVNLGTDNQSYDLLGRFDLLLSRQVIEFFARHYAAAQSRQDSRLSPLFASLTGLPPCLIQIGDHECFFGDAAAMHQALLAAGVDSELTVWKEMFHVWHLHWPMLTEARLAVEQVGKFIRLHSANAVA